jgi:hypothetical protein
MVAMFKYITNKEGTKLGYSTKSGILAIHVQSFVQRIALDLFLKNSKIFENYLLIVRIRKGIICNI